MKKLRRLSLPTRCVVEISDLNGIRAGFARAVYSGGLQVQFSPEYRTTFSPGQFAELTSNAAPVGPIRTSVQILAVNPSFDERGRPAVSTLLTFADLGETQKYAWESRLAALRPLVLTMGVDHSLEETCHQYCRVSRLSKQEDVTRVFDQEQVAVLVLGNQLTAIESHEILSRCQKEFPGSLTSNVIIGVGAEGHLFQDCIDEDRVFYLSRGPLRDAELRAVVLAAVDRFLVRLAGDDAVDAIPSEMLDFCAQLSCQSDLSSVTGVLAEAVKTLASADQSECLLYDPREEILWSKNRLTHQERTESVVSGLVGYVARTGDTVQLEKLGLDPRYDAEADNPGGDEESRFLAEPILGPTGGTKVALLGVVTAIRKGNSPSFSERDARVVELLAIYAGCVMGALLLQNRTQATLLERADPTGNPSCVYRQEALDYYRQSWDEEGDPLKSMPGLLKRSHWLVVVLLFACLLYLVFARIDEYATGPVIIRAKNKVTISAVTAGLVRSVEVSAGDLVKMGDVLVRFHDASGATTNVDQQLLRAPSDGVVSDIRVQPGQQVTGGDQVASIVDGTGGYDLIAFLPGAYAPQIHPGMQLVLKLVGYPDSHEPIPITLVSREIIGPHEAARYVGKESTDALQLAGPVVVVRSQLHSATFESRGRTFSYHDGMTGNAEVSVQSERVIVSLVPGLKEIINR